MAMTTFTTSTVINAPPDAVWSALADIGSISIWNPGVTASHTTSDVVSGLGATRHCDLGTRGFLEEQVVEFDEGSAITMRITDSNMPIEHADVRFVLEPETAGTRVTVSPQYRVKFGPLGILMDRVVVRRMFQRGMGSLLRGLKRHVESEVIAS